MDKHNFAFLISHEMYGSMYVGKDQELVAGRENAVTWNVSWEQASILEDLYRVKFQQPCYKQAVDILTLLEVVARHKGSDIFQSMATGKFIFLGEKYDTKEEAQKAVDNWLIVEGLN